MTYLIKDITGTITLTPNEKKIFDVLQKAAKETSSNIRVASWVRFFLA
jgi:hypothetical protein